MYENGSITEDITYFPQISTSRIASYGMLKALNSFRPFVLMNEEETQSAESPESPGRGLRSFKA